MLERIQKHVLGPHNPLAKGLGYKVVRITQNPAGTRVLQFMCCQNRTGYVMQQGVWLKAINRTLDKFDCKIKYVSGFHIFVDPMNVKNIPSWMKDCGANGVVRVRWRQGRILGAKDGRKIIVADRMFVM